jgi:hypothetical protein
MKIETKKRALSGASGISKRWQRPAAGMENCSAGSLSWRRRFKDGRTWTGGRQGAWRHAAPCALLASTSALASAAYFLRVPRITCASPLLAALRSWLTSTRCCFLTRAAHRAPYTAPPGIIAHAAHTALRWRASARHQNGRRVIRQRHGMAHQNWQYLGVNRTTRK